MAVSVADGPFVWVNQTALFAGLPLDSQLNTLSATTTGVFVGFSRATSSGPTDEPPRTILTKASTDQGATWSIFAPQYQGKKIQLAEDSLAEVSLADGRTLVGEVVSGQHATTGRYVTSTDGGTTWTPLAPAPGALHIMGLISTPNGTYYALMTNSLSLPGAVYVYRLAPGRSTWMLVCAQAAGNLSPIAVSWDGQGHPLALWSIGADGIFTHAP
jgi:hypothetical protein